MLCLVFLYVRTYLDLQEKMMRASVCLAAVMDMRMRAETSKALLS